MTEQLVLFQLKQMPDNLKQEVLDFIAFLFAKYKKTDPKPNLSGSVPKNPKPAFGCGVVNVKLAPDFDAPLDDFKDYMQ